MTGIADDSRIFQTIHGRRSALRDRREDGGRCVRSTTMVPRGDRAGTVTRNRGVGELAFAIVREIRLGRRAPRVELAGDKLDKRAEVVTEIVILPASPVRDFACGITWLANAPCDTWKLVEADSSLREDIRKPLLAFVAVKDPAFRSEPTRDGGQAEAAACREYRGDGGGNAMLPR